MDYAEGGQLFFHLRREQMLSEVRGGEPIWCFVDVSFVSPPFHIISPL